MLFVELKGTKIYVINESIWDEWNDRHAPQNGKNIKDNYCDLTAAAETTSDLDVSNSNIFYRKITRRKC